MNMSHHLGVIGAGILLASRIATAEPIVLDTEQKAAAAISTGLFTSNQVYVFNSNLTASAIDYADRALRVVRAATSPEALLTASGWTTINCPNAGTISARLTDTLPRVLKTRWNACAMPQFGLVRTYNGPLSITLTSDTFTPARLAAIRLGNARESFVETYRQETPDQIDDVTNTANLSLRGDIATFQAFLTEEGPVSAAYRVNGYYDMYRWLEFPDGRPSQPAALKLVADKLSVRETTQYGSTDDYQLQLSGGLTATQTQAPPYDSFSDSYRMTGYRLHLITDYEAWTAQLSVDGKIAVVWAPQWGSGCMNGEYAFKTRAPLMRNADSVVYDAGELIANGAANARFYSSANVPPGLPPPANGQAINLRVRDVGTFHYDAASYLVLRQVGQCPL